jgi:hypothetical protein
MGPREIAFNRDLSEIKMKSLRVLLAFLAFFFLATPSLRAQDLSKYRAFSLGNSLATVLKHTDQKVEDVKFIHGHPVLLQELTWWPPSLPGATYRSDSVEQIHFSFCNAALYKISVTYDRGSTEGLTREDIVKSLSAKYGTPATLASGGDSATKEQSEAREEPIASWEDPQTSVNLVGSVYSGGFNLLISSKRVNAEAELALAEAARLDKQQEPQKEAERLKKEVDDLQLTRQKNQKSFRP